MSFGISPSASATSSSLSSSSSSASPSSLSSLSCCSYRNTPVSNSVKKSYSQISSSWQAISELRAVTRTMTVKCSSNMAISLATTTEHIQSVVEAFSQQLQWSHVNQYNQYLTNSLYHFLALNNYLRVTEPITVHCTRLTRIKIYHKLLILKTAIFKTIYSPSQKSKYIAKFTYSYWSQTHLIV